MGDELYEAVNVYSRDNDSIDTANQKQSPVPHNMTNLAEIELQANDIVSMSNSVTSNQTALTEGTDWDWKDQDKGEIYLYDSKVFYEIALANESNYFIKEIAFGNGGTDINAALDITFNPANDGQSPDIRTWDSQLYNETYREIVDDSDISVGTGVGSAPGDPTTVEHVSGPGVFSNELGILSQITVNSTINRDEPTGQIASGTDAQGANFDGSFTFDEIGLFTGGLPTSATAGYHDVEVGLPAE
ncbi:hypothetical protein LCGC14_3143560, partial [marine sediment metagenome]